MTHYDVLGIPKNADADTIKRAYRKKSREHHPDRPGGSTTAMIAVNRAHDTLSDPEKRARYDQCGEDRPPQPPLDVMAANAVCTIFLQLLEQITDYDNVVRLTRDQIRLNQKQIQQAAQQAKDKIVKLRSRKRLKYKGAGSQGNFIDDTLAQQIGALEATIAKVEEQTKVGDRAMELLKDFDWEAEQRKGEPTVSPWTALFTFRGDT